MVTPEELDTEEEEARCTELGHRIKELYGEDVTFVAMVIDDKVHFTSSVQERKTLASLLRKAANIVEFDDPIAEGIHQ